MGIANTKSNSPLNNFSESYFLLRRLGESEQERWIEAVIEAKKNDRKEKTI